MLTFNVESFINQCYNVRAFLILFSSRAENVLFFTVGQYVKIRQAYFVKVLHILTTTVMKFPENVEFRLSPQSLSPHKFHYSVVGCLFVFQYLNHSLFYCNHYVDQRENSPENAVVCYDVLSPQRSDFIYGLLKFCRRNTKDNFKLYY